VDEGDGTTIDSRTSLVSPGSWVSGALGLGIGVAEDDGTTVGSRMSLVGSGSRIAEGDGTTIDSRTSLVGSGSWVSGALELGIGVAEDDGTTVGSRILLVGSGFRIAEGDGAEIDSWTSGVDTTTELDGTGGLTDDEEETADETGTGDSSRRMELDKTSSFSGSGVETMSRVEVRVLVGSTSLALTMGSEEDASFEVSELVRKSDSTNDVKSIWRDSSCSDELSAKVDDEGVGVASAVVLGMICRFTCLGK
jgi:hypothetical protein